ncbi:aldo/keto reductase [Aliamphritea spongicola]|nr:aldo/keto reductase [Aliamphritea spongicola]
MRGTAASTGLESDSLDVLVLGFCLYLCDRNELFKIAYECDRILRDTGLLLIVDFMPPFAYKNPYHHLEGLNSYKQDYSKMFLWNPAYRLIHLETANLPRNPNVPMNPDHCVGLTVLHKNQTHAYPESPLVSNKFSDWLLGTAQFGMPYGVTNDRGQTSADEAWRMINLALRSGAVGVDTAAGYGDAEKVLSLDVLSARITTKVSCQSDLTIRQQVENSLVNMGCSCVDSVLIHDAESLKISGALQSVSRQLEELKSEQLITAAGVSVYEVEQTKALLDHWIPDVVQIPLNPLNQSF